MDSPIAVSWTGKEMAAQTHRDADRVASGAIAVVMKTDLVGG
jgi:hypothetical protein